MLKEADLRIGFTAAFRNLMAEWHARYGGKLALVAGATGVLGRNLLQHLLDQEDWGVVAVSRRRPNIAGDYQHLSVDLLDRDVTLKTLGQLAGVTHVFYSAYVERSGWAAMVPPNLAMLVNTLDAVETGSPLLAHVNLMQGTK